MRRFKDSVPTLQMGANSTVAVSGGVVDDDGDGCDVSEWQRAASRPRHELVLGDLCPPRNMLPAYAALERSLQWEETSY